MQGFEEATGPSSHPEIVPVPNHDTLSHFMAWVTPDTAPHTQEFLRLPFCSQPRARQTLCPDCLPCCRLLQLACSQEPDSTPGPQIILRQLTWERDLRGPVATSHWVVSEVPSLGPAGIKWPG